MLGKIEKTCYTADIETRTETHVTGTLHRHVDNCHDYSRPFRVKIKPNGSFLITPHSGPSCSISDYFTIKNMVPDKV